MKKREVLKLLPMKQQLRRDSQRDRIMALKLLEKYVDAKRKVDYLDNIVLHEGYPIRVSLQSRDIEVSGACDELKRRAYATRIGKGYSVSLYKGTDAESDGIAVEGVLTKANAIKSMKDWVVNGKRS